MYITSHCTKSDIVESGPSPPPPLHPGTGGGLLEQSITRAPHSRGAADDGDAADGGEGRRTRARAAAKNRSAPRRVRGGPCGGAPALSRPRPDERFAPSARVSCIPVARLYAVSTVPSPVPQSPCAACSHQTRIKTRRRQRHTYYYNIIVCNSACCRDTASETTAGPGP